MVEVNIGQLDIIKKIVEALADDARSTKFVLDEGATFVLNRTRQRFLREVDPEGTPWIPSQAAIRRRKKKGTGTLFDTGRLFHSIQATGQSGTFSRRVGTDVPYGAHHQFGTPKLPKRVFLGVTQPDADLLGKFLTLRLDDFMKNAAQS